MTAANENNQYDQTLKQRLEDIHDFPASFTLKAIGDNTPDFIEKVSTIAQNTLTDSNNLTINTNESSAGKHVSIRLTFTAKDSDQFIELYKKLHEIKEIRFLI